MWFLGFFTAAILVSVMFGLLDVIYPDNLNK